MKFGKTLGLALAVIVGLPILAAIALLLLVDPNRYRDAIEHKVQAATGRPFAITGAMKLKLFPWLALDVGGISIGNPPGFAAAPLLTAERLRVGVRLLPLIHGELDVDRVAADGLNVALIKRADGRSNWQFPGDSSAPAGARGATSPGSVSVAGLDVSRATITLADEAAKSLTRVQDLELHTGALGASRPADFSLSAKLDAGEGTPAVRADLRTRATVDAQASIVTLENLSISGERGPAPATTFSLSAPKLALDWKSGTLAPATLALRLGELALDADVAADQLRGTPAIKGGFRMPEQSLRKLAPSLGLTIGPTRDAAAFTRVAASGNFRVIGSAVRLDDLVLTLDRSRVRGHLAVDGQATPAIDAVLDVDAIDLDGYRAPIAATQTAAQSDAAKRGPATPAPLPFAALRALNARGSVTVAKASVGGLALSDVRVLADAHAGRLHIAPSAHAFGGTASGDISLDAAREPADLALNAAVHDLDIGAAVKAYAKSDRIAGRGNLDLKLSGTGRTAAALADSLAGPINFDVKNGALEGLDLSYEIERAQALLHGGAPPARAGPPRTPFNTFAGRSHLERGVLTTDALNLETPLMKVAGKGTLRLADQAINYDLTARVQGIAAANRGSVLAELQSLDIPISITGTVHDYKVRPDLAGIAKNRVKQEIEKRKDDLRNAVTDKLKDLFKR